MLRVVTDDDDGDHDYDDVDDKSYGGDDDDDVGDNADGDDDDLLASEQHWVVFSHFGHCLTSTLHVLAISDHDDNNYYNNNNHNYDYKSTLHILAILKN